MKVDMSRPRDPASRVALEKGLNAANTIQRSRESGAKSLGWRETKGGGRHSIFRGIPEAWLEKGCHASKLGTTTRDFVENAASFPLSPR